MTQPRFFTLEFRRLGVAIGLAFTHWLITGDWKLSVALCFACLALTWGWQLARLYRWFEEPDDLPSIGGSGVKGVLRDVYLLRSRAPAASAKGQRPHPYPRENLGSMRDPALIINSDTRLVWCNDAAEYLLGIRFEEEEGKLLSDVIPGKHLKRYVKKEIFQKPLRVKPGPDPEFCIQFEFSNFGADDRLVFVKDVTEQDKLERMRRDFVGNVSHELRTPLTVIKGYIETLQSLANASDRTLRRSLGSMDTQVNRMERLIEDLLWLSRIESVEGERKDDEVHVVDLLVDVREGLTAGWPDRELQLDITSNHRILGSATELRSAISNLVVNALKYSDGAVTIRWTDTVVGPSLAVEDIGEGIEAKHIPRLTERFYRVEKSRSQGTGGTGLGLAIVKHVAVSHDAKFFVDSELGKGSVFRLVFPNDRIVVE